jgi:hypothetical protein
MTEPTMDVDGNLHFRWVTPGGCQVTGRLFVAHAQRVCSAWRMREAIETHASDLYRVSEAKAALALPALRRQA